MIPLLSAEWLKLRSVRSTWLNVAAVVVLLALCGLWSFAVAGIWDGRPPAERVRMRAAPPEYPMSLALPLCTGVLGVLAITAEHATGMIRTSLAAVPRRGRLLAAKAGVVAAAALAVGLVAFTAAALLGRLIVGGRGVPEFHRPVGEEVPWIASLCLLVVVSALVGLGLGTVLRSTAGGVAAVTALLFVLPTLVTTVAPDPWNERIGRLLPTSLFAQLAGRTGTLLDDPLPPAAAGALLVGYAAAALAAGALVLARRDV
ncbi:ABC transporter permease [Actinomadura kijaniata]|uniref:ABC transporter permease n=1 Tax=Actinomadura kijaniata TaxID=46161 RepID=UPI003F1B944A